MDGGYEEGYTDGVETALDIVEGILLESPEVHIDTVDEVVNALLRVIKEDD